MSLMSFYDRLMEDHSDPRVVNWQMMSGAGPTLYIVAAYLLLVTLFLPAYMKHRKPYNLTTIIKCYNIIQVISCLGLIYMMSSAGWVQGEYSLGCQPIDYSENPNALKLLNAFYWLYILKMVELSETVFFALRKKFNQISALHTYHHASTLLFAFIGCKFIGGGMFAIPSLMNLVIHVFMYTYYYLSSLGPEWQKTLEPWKPKLTMAQMIQFTMMLIHSATAFLPGCQVPKAVFLLYLPNIILLYKMFYDFYVESYHKKEQRAKVTS